MNKATQLNFEKLKKLDHKLMKNWIFQVFPREKVPQNQKMEFGEESIV